MRRLLSFQNFQRLFFESEDHDVEDFYIEDIDTTSTTTTNGQQQQQYHGYPTGDSDASFASFYYYNNSSVVQTPPVPVPVPVQRHPPAKLTSALHSTGPSAFYAGPVRGAGYYSIRTDTQQGDPF